MKGAEVSVCISTIILCVCARVCVTTRVCVYVRTRMPVCLCVW